MNDFGVSPLVATLPFSLYLFGLAIGLPVFAISEKYGRKTVLLTCFTIFSLFILECGLSKSAAVLILCRFFAGVFASPCINVSTVAINEILVEHSYSSMISICSGLLGPAIG